MNPRIKELSEQAECFSHKVPQGLAHLVTEHELEEFAELIVRECIRCCDDIDAIQKHYLKYHIDLELGASECIEVIKNHFGMEE